MSNNKDFEVKLGVSLDNNSLDKAEKQINKATEKERKIKFEIESKSLENEINKMISSYNKLKAPSKELKNIVADVKREYTNLSKAAVSGVGDIIKAYEKLEAKMTKISNITKTSSKAEKEAQSEVGKALKEREKALKQQEQQQKAQQKIQEQAANEQRKINKEQQKNNTKLIEDKKKANQAELKQEQKLKKEQEKSSAKTDKKAENITTKFNNGDMDNQMSKIMSSYDKMIVKSERAQQSVEEYKNALRTLGSSIETGDSNAIVQAYDTCINKSKEATNVVQMEAREALDAAKKVKQAAEEKAAAEKDVSDRETKAIKASNLSLDIDNYMQKNTRAAGRFGDKLKILKQQLTDVDNCNLKNIDLEFKNVQKSAKKLGLDGVTFVDELKKKFTELSSYVSVATVMYGAQAAFRAAYDNIYAIDTAMTELKKVTDETNKSYSDFLNNASGSAKEIGTTIADYITSTADFARLGYNFADSQELAKTANIYNVVGDELNGIEDATKSVISTMAAYNVQVKDSISVVDKYNEVSKHIAQQYGNMLKENSYIGQMLEVA